MDNLKRLGLIFILHLIFSKGILIIFDMPKSKSIAWIMPLWIFCLFFYAGVQAAGLSTGFSEVTLEDLEVGKTYSTSKTAGLPLVVVNTGKEPVELKIEVLLPVTEELKKDFEPIPDISWIKLEQTEFKNVKPNESATTDMLITIPNKKQYQGKNFQVFIWTHTVGRSIGIGLKSKLLLKIRGE